MAPSLALAMLAISATARADNALQDLIEARQETQISTTYALSPYLRANDLRVMVDNGKATLRGTVEDSVNKDLAAQIALGVKGVSEVDNRIVVQAGYITTSLPSERSYGEVVDDAGITASVKSKLMWSKYTDGLRTEVDTHRGKLKLSGTADSAAAKQLAGELAYNTRGVVSVDNQLKVAAAKPTLIGKTMTAVRKAGDDVADGWISNKVKSTLLYSSNVDGSDIQVETKNGVVTLSGKLDSGAERALAIELAKNVRGVKSVQSSRLTI